MAEGSEPDDQKNQFSFQDFIKSSEHVKKDEASEKKNSRGDTISKPDLGFPSGREVFRTDEDKVIRREENPFSFRQFLKKDNITSANANREKHHYQSGTPRNVLRGPITAPDFASGLPDFVQDHIVYDNNVFDESADAKDQHQPCDSNSLPDFAVNSNLLSNEHHHNSYDKRDDEIGCHPKKPLPKGSQDDLLFNVSCKPKNIRRSAIPQTDSAVTSSLPDFLSDGPMLSNHVAIRNEDKSHTGVSRPSSCSEVERRRNETLTLEIVKIKSENDSLVQQLNEVKKLLSLESQKVAGLSQEVSTLKKKEKDETAALEAMVQQVERNLQSTIERAVTAENAVLKLRQESKSFQEQMHLLTEENSALRNGDYQLLSVKEKTKVISGQITAAASTAEQQLRQLLSGVNSLKILATCLLDIDKVVEDPLANPDNSNS